MPQNSTESAISKLFRFAQGFHHQIAGWVFLRLGNPLLAQIHYERVAALHGAHFAAHVQLGRIAYAMGDYPKWQHEFEQAHSISEKRFAKLRDRYVAQEARLAGVSHTPSHNRPIWQAVAPAPRELRTRPERPHSYIRPLGEAEAMSSCTSDDFASDDFASDAERAKFRRSSPIESSEVYSCDLDELSRRLST